MPLSFLQLASLSVAVPSLIFAGYWAAARVTPRSRLDYPARSRKLRLTFLSVAFICTVLIPVGVLTYYLCGGGDGLPEAARAMPDVENLLTNIKVYEDLNGAPPSTEQGLQALVTKPVGDPAPSHWRQLLPAVPVDPWGTRYFYRFPAVKSHAPYDIFSAGKDQRPDTADDIGNW